MLLTYLMLLCCPIYLGSALLVISRQASLFSLASGSKFSFVYSLPPVCGMVSSSSLLLYNISYEPYYVIGATTTTTTIYSNLLNLKISFYISFLNLLFVLLINYLPATNELS